MDEFAVNRIGKKRVRNEHSIDHPAEKVVKKEEEEEEITTANNEDSNQQQSAGKIVKREEEDDEDEEIRRNPSSVVRRASNVAAYRNIMLNEYSTNARHSISAAPPPLLCLSDVNDIAKALQYGPRVRCLIVQPGVFGLVATEQVEKGDYVAELLGYVSLEGECPDRDLVSGSLNDHTFLLELGEDRMIIDARKCGDVSKYLRRSCKPNAELVPMMWDSKMHIMIKATQALKTDEEVSIKLEEGWMARPAPTQGCGCDKRMEVADCELQRFFYGQRKGATINYEDSNELPDETALVIKEEDEEPLSSPPPHSQLPIELHKKADTAAAAAAPSAAVAAAADAARSGDSGEDSDDEAWEISCICGQKEEDGEVMVQCDQCILRWEHVDCIFPRMKKAPSGIYYCHVCKPRATELSPEQARAYQDRVKAEKKLAKERLEKQAAAAKRKE